MVHRTAVRTSVFFKDATKQVCQSCKHAPYCGFNAFTKHAILPNFLIPALASKTSPGGPNEPSNCSEKSFCDPGGILANFWCRASAHFCASNLKPKFTISAGAPGTPPEAPNELTNCSKMQFGDPRGILGYFGGCCRDAFSDRINIFAADL